MKSLQLLTICFLTWIAFAACKDKTPEMDNNKDDFENIYAMAPYEINFENDSVKIVSLNFPSEDQFIPGITEVWRVDKSTGDSILCAKSDPRYFGVGRDSIPSIMNVIYNPYDEKLIVEGPTCHAGLMATYIVDAKTGERICLPSNYGFIGYTNWDNYIIASSKFNDIDCDMVSWYETIYVLDWDGNIIAETSTKDAAIERGLPYIHNEAGLDIDQIKFINHQQLTPQYPDSSYYGNEFRVEYPEIAIKEIKNLSANNSLPEGWSKQGHIYYYYSNDSELEMFLTITIDTKQNTGIIRKGMYSNPLNIPKRAANG